MILMFENKLLPLDHYNWTQNALVLDFLVNGSCVGVFFLKYPSNLDNCYFMLPGLEYDAHYAPDSQFEHICFFKIYN